MTTLITANIQTVDATTDLVVGLGNNPRIILYSNNSGIAITDNTANVILSINSSSNVVLANTVLGAGGGLSSVANVTGTGQLISSGNITPTIITSNTTAYNPTGLANSFILRIQANSTASGSNTTISEPYISGIVPNINNQIITISNIGSQKIQLRNEDSVNETTAANRFHLPNNVWLYGYQSIQLIYDGVKSRWTPLTFLGASPILSLGYDYDNTITLRTDYKSLLTKGFYTANANSDKTTYSTETNAATPGVNLSTSRYSIGQATGNVDKGFVSGGFPAVAVSDKVTYSSETTAAVAGANLSQARWNLAAAGNVDKGFYVGGAVGPLSPFESVVAGRTTYSSETHAAVTSANLTQARNAVSGYGNADKGFFGGGELRPASPSTTTNGRIIYSTETYSVVASASFTTAVGGAGGSGNCDKGFWIATTVANKTIYSTETTVAVSAAVLSQTRQAVPYGNSGKGFRAGGESPTSPGATSGPTTVTTVDRVTYSSETTAASAGAALSSGKAYFSGV